MTVAPPPLLRWIRPTRLTVAASIAIALVIASSAGFLATRYSALPWVLAVHFRPGGVPDGWQYKTVARVLLPVLVQTALALVLGALAGLLLSRRHRGEERLAADIRAAAAAAECVALLGLIWVAFQAYAAVALAAMWQRERGGLDGSYAAVEVLGVLLTIAVAMRAHFQLGAPARRPFVTEHWKFGQLYHNPGDPALFVPTRHGGRWTLNFGRPVAVPLMGAILGIGIVGPALMLGLLLR